MRRIRINPMDHPKLAGEPWWIVHPNDGRCEFRIPSGAITVCTENFLDEFKKDIVYNVVGADNHDGYVVVAGAEDLYEMPQYLFARYFDAESFVTGRANLTELANAKPFDYKPTLPRNPKYTEYKDVDHD